MVAVTPQLDFAFASVNESRQFYSLRDVLPGNWILFHNFYIMQISPSFYPFENDFGILSEDFLCIIEHKSSLGYARGVISKVQMMPNTLLKWFESVPRNMKRNDLPIFHSRIMVDQSRKKCRSNTSNIIECVDSISLDETREFLEHVLNKLRRRKTLYGTEKIFEAIISNSSISKYNALSEGTFKIFCEIEEIAKRIQVQNIAVGECELSNLYIRTVRACSSLQFFAWDALSNIEKERAENKLNEIFHLHMPDFRTWRKLLTTFWIAMTDSEDKKYDNFVQITIQIGNKDVYSGNSDITRYHLAVKLFVYKDVDYNMFVPFIQRINTREGEAKFKELLQGLNADIEEEDKYFFAERISHFHRRRYDLDENAEYICKVLKSYNSPSQRNRSIEFVRYLDWKDRKTRDKLKRKNSASRLITEEYKRLLPLYYFMTGRDLMDKELLLSNQ